MQISRAMWPIAYSMPHHPHLKNPRHFPHHPHHPHHRFLISSSSTASIGVGMGMGRGEGHISTMNGGFVALGERAPEDIFVARVVTLCGLISSAFRG